LAWVVVRLSTNHVILLMCTITLSLSQTYSVMHVKGAMWTGIVSQIV